MAFDCCDLLIKSVTFLPWSLSFSFFFLLMNHSLWVCDFLCNESSKEKKTQKVLNIYKQRRRIPQVIWEDMREKQQHPPLQPLSQIQITAVLTIILMRDKWEAPASSLSHLSASETETSTCGLEPLSFGAICYTAFNVYYNPCPEL